MCGSYDPTRSVSYSNFFRRQPAYHLGSIPVAIYLLQATTSLTSINLCHMQFCLYTYYLVVNCYDKKLALYERIYNRDGYELIYDVLTRGRDSRRLWLYILVEGSGVLADPSRILGCEFRRYKITLKIVYIAKKIMKTLVD